VSDGEWISLSHEEFSEIRFPQSPDVNRTSPPSFDYNCLSWAFGRNDVHYDPSDSRLGYTWDDDADREWSHAVIQKMFEKRGYVVCDNGAHEPGFIKVSSKGK
jgi:hypothetical protein